MANGEKSLNRPIENDEFWAQYTGYIVLLSRSYGCPVGLSSGEKRKASGEIAKKREIYFNANPVRD
jgi:hypothetical protein